jgi:GNAT superfamily N-acetyltransferase
VDLGDLERTLDSSASEKLFAGRETETGLPDFRVRAIERADREQWGGLWRAYLDFYRAAKSEEVENATWARIFDALEPVHAVVAERDDTLIGFSHYLFQRSTWFLNSQCYLQDLYVAEAARGCGVGRALIAVVVGAAREAGAARVYWNTHETNAVARRLYDAVAERTGFIQYRIEPLGQGRTRPKVACPADLPHGGTSPMLVCRGRAWRLAGPAKCGEFHGVAKCHRACSRHRSGERAGGS